MAQPDLHPDCPAAPTLMGWVDGTLDGTAADEVERHMKNCGSCRRRALELSEQLAAAPVDRQVSAGCIDDETLVAYCVAGRGLDRGAAARVESHLQQRTRCVSTLQQFLRVHREPVAAEAAAAVRVESAAAAFAGRAVASPPEGRRVRAAVRAWWESLGELVTLRKWPGATVAAAMALLVVVGVSRFLSPSGPYEEMRVRNAAHAATVEVIADTISRPWPALDEPVLVELARGPQAGWLETSGQWTRLELADGRRVWVDSKAVARVRTE